MKTTKEYIKRKGKELADAVDKEIFDTLEKEWNLSDKRLCVNKRTRNFHYPVQRKCWFFIT